MKGIIQKQEIQAAFFDLDHTIINCSSGAQFLIEAFKRRLIPFITLALVPTFFFRYKFLHPDWSDWTYKIPGINGKSKELLYDIADYVYDEKIKHTYISEIIEEINNYKTIGTPVVIATASTDFLARQVMEKLQLDTLICSRLEFDDKNLTTGRFLGNPVFGKKKQELVEKLAEKEGWDLSKCAFYSDSIHDLPIMTTCGYPVATNPDSRLRKYAKSKNWSIIL
jgi:HAD superfamily hydrolase (TIGR01490 family)